ncbi:MAG: AmmeMemoRadiSam system protein B [Paludisphaera borealis]|uniref:AmmeMemoRadiSam system protein B n=1 Tax=Paludisphaera borealis TaxID=1387353 RepID=UPI002846B925|nr:AmmeMemoRadiSam system protein B [Paludisphaera borealis]MDR3618142.1 AmmeMemoRadiSam system protein B [Paludisphaera borealis]
MAPLDRPKLRSLAARRLEHMGQLFVVLEDPLRLCPNPVVLALDVFNEVVRHFNGRNSLRDIQTLVLESTSQYLEMAAIQQLVDQLDQALALESPAYAVAVRSFLDATERPAALAGLSYASEPKRLRSDLDRFFKARDGAGVLALPPPAARNGDDDRSAKPRLRAIVSPHIDFPRGGPVYTWAYKTLVERSDADVFVILGVAHQHCRRRFVLTRKDFATPLGVVSTDREYVDRLAEAAGAHLFDDELTHRSEHSIEFQAVFLKHVLGDRPFTIVPILVGSFHDLMKRKADPITDPEVERFIRALRRTELASGRKVAYIGGIDLCHVGPEFGDPEPVDAALQNRIRAFDHEMLARAEAVDPVGWFRTASDVGDRWRVCGLAAAYTMLHVLGPSRGELLKYNQAVDDRKTCCVSFASMVFHSVAAAVE